MLAGQRNRGPVQQHVQQPVQQPAQPPPREALRQAVQEVQRQQAAQRAQRQQAAQQLRARVANRYQAMNRELVGDGAPGVAPYVLQIPNPDPNLNRRPAPNPARNPQAPAVHARNHRPNPAPIPADPPPPYPGVGHNAMPHNRHILNAQLPANVPGWHPGGPHLFNLGLDLGVLPPNDGFGLPQMAAAQAPRRAALPPALAALDLPVPGFNMQHAGPAQGVALPPRQQIPVVDLTVDD